jgi:hypothetical protein
LIEACVKLSCTPPEEMVDFFDFDEESTTFLVKVHRGGKGKKEEP